jgi:hypothetical protein
MAVHLVDEFECRWIGVMDSKHGDGVGARVDDERVAATDYEGMRRAPTGAVGS